MEGSQSLPIVHPVDEANKVDFPPACVVFSSEMASAHDFFSLPPALDSTTLDEAETSRHNKSSRVLTASTNRSKQ